MDFSGLSPSDQAYMAQVLERKQMQDFVRMYNHLSERCFSDCVNDFTSRTTTTKEQGCVGRCVQKFVQLSQRVGQRFSEQQALQAEQQAAAAAAGTR